MTKYFIIGLNKTGTTSIRHALGGALQTECITSIRSMYKIDAILSFTDSLIREGKIIFKDRPWNSGCYKELNERYPNSKFILTIRDQEEWWLSVKDWLSMKAKWTKKLNRDNKIRKLASKIKTYNRHFNCPKINKNCYINYYNSYNNAVIEYFKNKSNFYILNLRKDFNWTSIQKITNLKEKTIIHNIRKTLRRKDFIPDDFNGKIENLEFKDFKFIQRNKNNLV